MRWLFAAVFALGAYVWAVGREDHQQPTADLHADAAYYYVYLPSIALDRDLDFTNEYRETKNWYHLGPTPLGRPGNVFGIGPAVFGAPLFLVGHALALATGERRDGFSSYEVRLFTIQSLAWTLAAVAVAMRLVRRRFGGGGLAVVGPLLAALAGPVVYYAIRQPGYAHPLATFWATLLVERWDASYAARPRSLRTWLGLGAVFGATVLARPQLALWGMLLVAAAVDDLRGRATLAGWRTQLPIRWLAGAAVALVAFAPQLVAWKVLYGSWYVVPQGAGFMRWDAPCWSETLFSSRNGLFPWAPALLIFLLALVPAARKLPRLAIALGGGLALQAIANGAAWDWWAGGSFGGRRFDSTYVVFAIGAAAIVAWIARVVPPAMQRVAAVRVRAVAVAAIAAGALVGVLVLANLELVEFYTVTNARIGGGGPASSVIRAHGGTPGKLAAIASWATNLPVRAIYAWRHDAALDTYDRVVGVHALGDTYPGLNEFADRRVGVIALDVPNPRLFGLARGIATGTASLAGSRAHILVGLNRTGSIAFTIPASGAGHATVTWNGSRVVDAELGAPLRFTTTDLVRGTNDLVIEAPAGTLLSPIEVVDSSRHEQ